MDPTNCQGVLHADKHGAHCKDLQHGPNQFVNTTGELAEITDVTVCSKRRRATMIDMRPLVP